MMYVLAAVSVLIYLMFLYCLYKALAAHTRYKEVRAVRGSLRSYPSTMLLVETSINALVTWCTNTVVAFVMLVCLLYSLVKMFYGTD
jgi:uncharacterized membrane protein